MSEGRLKMLLEESTSLERRLGCLERQMEGDGNTFFTSKGVTYEISKRKKQIEND